MQRSILTQEYIILCMYMYGVNLPPLFQTVRGDEKKIEIAGVWNGQY